MLESKNNFQFTRLCISRYFVLLFGRSNFCSAKCTTSKNTFIIEGLHASHTLYHGMTIVARGDGCSKSSTGTRRWVKKSVDEPASKLGSAESSPLATFWCNVFSNLLVYLFLCRKVGFWFSVGSISISPEGQ